MKLKTSISAIAILISILTFYFFDPAFKREVIFEEYSVQYDWRIFNHSFCKSKNLELCSSNKTNKTNAEIELYLKLLSLADKNKQIENKLKEVVRSTYRFHRTYIELTRSDDIQIDSLRKYKNQIFKKVI